MRPDTYLKTLWRSLTSIEYYVRVLEAPLSFTLRFFLITIVLIGVIAGWFFAREFTRFVTETLPPTLELAAEHFPEDGSIRWNGDELLVSPDPFIVYYPDTLPEQYAPATDRVAVLTNSETTPEEFFTTSEESAYSLITPTTLFVRNNTGNWINAPLQSNLQDQLLLVSEETLPQHFTAITDWVGESLPAAQVVFPLVTVVVLLLHRAWTALIESLLVYLLFRFNQINLSFLKSFQLALHLIIPAEIVHQLATVLYPRLDFSLLSLAFWVLLLYFFFTQRRTVRQRLAHF